MLLQRNKTAVSDIINTVISDEPSEFTDFIDDDGHGVGPFAIKCKMTKRNGKLHFDWNGTSPQSEYSINYLLSNQMFTMYIVYVFEPLRPLNHTLTSDLDTTFWRFLIPTRWSTAGPMSSSRPTSPQERFSTRFALRR